MNVKHFVQATVHNVRQFFRSMISQPNENPPNIPFQSGEAQSPFSGAPANPSMTIENAESSASHTEQIIGVHDERELHIAEAWSAPETLDGPEQSLPPALSLGEIDPVLPAQAEPSLNHPIDKAVEPLYLEICGEKRHLTAVLESLLFVADTPVEPASLARLLNFDTNTIEAGLQALAQTYTDEGRGLRLQERNGKFQLVTMPAAAAIIEDFLNLEATTKLSGPALETLAVIAYRQPITRMQIEAVRGVDSAGVLRSLVQRGLAEEVGRLEVAGRPILYGVTDLFMQHFGLTKLGELPPLESSEADTLWATTKLAELSNLAN